MVQLMHAMLGSRLGGLEQVFVDYQPILDDYAKAHNGRCKAVVRKGGATAAAVGTRFEALAIPAWSDWDPVTTLIGKKALNTYPVDAAISHGQRAYRLLARTLPKTTTLVACIHKPSFDVDLKRTHYLCVAKHLADAIQARGVSPDRIHVLPNTIVIPKQAATPFAQAAKPHIIAAGRLHSKKGFDLFLRALANIKSRGTDFRATIFGEGGERQLLENMVRELGLQDHVSMPGWSNDMARELRTGDIFAFPSRQEGFPLMLLEAMATGLPVVATRIPGTDEIIADPRLGTLVERDDEQALATAMQQFLTDRQAAVAIGEAARAHIMQNYDKNSLPEKLAKVMDNILGDKIERARQ